MGKIIGVSGKARHGKGVFAQIAVDKYGAIPISFAAGVKEEVADWLDRSGVGFEPRHLYGEQSDKEERLAINLREIYAEDSFIWDFIRDYGEVVGSTCAFTPRALMQWWGTEYRREQDDNYWVSKAMAKCNDSMYPANQLFVIDDCRFKNEAMAIRAQGGVLVRVVRTDAPTPSNPDHPSEVDLDDWEEWDVYIANVGTIEEYQEMCDYIIECICAEHDMGNA